MLTLLTWRDTAVWGSIPVLVVAALILVSIVLLGGIGNPWGLALASSRCRCQHRLQTETSKKPLSIWWIAAGLSIKG